MQHSLQTPTFDVRLPCLIEELRYSCPCATGTIGDTQRLPVRVSAGDTIPVTITVKSLQGENGPVELRFGVVGRIGDEPVEAGAVAAVRFVQHLNADPPVLTFGRVEEAAGECMKTVELWYPCDGHVPDQELTVESDDPCIRPRLQLFETPLSSNDGGNERITFARVVVTLDAKIAPERMKAFVTARSGPDELRIPILGVIERASGETNFR